MSQKRQFFRRKYLKIITSVPAHGHVTQGAGPSGEASTRVRKSVTVAVKASGQLVTSVAGVTPPPAVAPVDRVTRSVCEKIAQNVAQPLFCQNEYVRCRKLCDNYT
jgi:hypothetical protein